MSIDCSCTREFRPRGFVYAASSAAAPTSKIQKDGTCRSAKSRSTTVLEISAVSIAHSRRVSTSRRRAKRGHQPNIEIVWKPRISIGCSKGQQHVGSAWDEDSANTDLTLCQTAPGKYRSRQPQGFFNGVRNQRRHWLVKEIFDDLPPELGDGSALDMRVPYVGWTWPKRVAFYCVAIPQKWSSWLRCQSCRSKTDKTMCDFPRLPRVVSRGDALMRVRPNWGSVTSDGRGVLSLPTAEDGSSCCV